MAYKMLDGNAAAVEAMVLARVKVISAYPITPQSYIAEKLADLVAKGVWMPNISGSNRSIRL